MFFFFPFSKNLRNFVFYMGNIFLKEISCTWYTPKCKYLLFRCRVFQGGVFENLASSSISLITLSRLLLLVKLDPLCGKFEIWIAFVTHHTCSANDANKDLSSGSATQLIREAFLSSEIPQLCFKIMWD